MKQNILKDFNLPSYIKGKSFSDASKAIENKFKDREDKSSMETKDTLLQRLADAQEYIKSQDIEYSNNNDYFLGGLFGGEEATGTQMNAGEYAAAAGTALEFGNQIFNKDKSIDLSGNTEYSRNDIGGSGISGAVKGVQAGQSFGPVGAAIGGVLGGVGGIVSASKQNDNILKSEYNKTSADYNRATRDYMYGGELNNNPTNPKKLKKHKDSELISLPDDNNERISYANRKKLSVQQLGGFEDQKESDSEWRNKRDKYFSDEFSKWRSGKTGATPHNKYSQSHPEYQAAWKRIKDDFYKNNPRQINNIVTDYRVNGPAGKGRGQTFGIPDYSPSKEMLASNDYKKGGNMSNSYMTGGDLEIVNSLKPVNPFSLDLDGYNTGSDLINSNNALQDLQSSASNVVDNIDLTTDPNFNNVQNNSTSTSGKSPLDFVKNNYADILRYVPIAANAAQLASFEKPSKEILDKVDNRYERNYVDERSLVNSVNDNFNESYLTESSGGSQGRYAANARAAQLAKVKATSDAYLRADDINRSVDDRGQEFENRNDLFNIGQTNRENEIDAQNIGAYNTQKSEAISQLGTDIGNVGREEKYKQMVKESGLCYDSRGKYICGSGERVPDDVNINDTNDNKYGGSMNSNHLFSSYLDKVLNKK